MAYSKEKSLTHRHETRKSHDLQSVRGISFQRLKIHYRIVNPDTDYCLVCQIYSIVCLFTGLMLHLSFRFQTHGLMRGYIYIMLKSKLLGLL